MAHEKNTKLKLPHAPSQIKAFEDQLRAMADVLKEIRLGMTDHGIENVELMSGTFQMHADKTEEQVHKFRGVYTVEEAKKIREKAKADPTLGRKKRQ